MWSKRYVWIIIRTTRSMPFTKDGMIPDNDINPHIIPTRILINQLLEVILGKSGCLGGL